MRLRHQDSAAETFSDQGFVSELVVTFAPFTLVGMAWAPDGRLFVWQKNGVVSVVKDGVLLPTPFIDLSAKVNTFDDRGSGASPSIPTSPTTATSTCRTSSRTVATPTTPAPRPLALTRVTADPSNPDVALPGSEMVILGSIGTPPCSAQPAGSDCIAADGGSHTIGTIRFAADGTVFVGNGDGADAAFADPTALRAQDLE